MINVNSKRCIENNCSKQPNFNYLSEKTGLYCSEHKKENMINVITKRCIEINCNKHPCCNYPSEKNALYCSEHKNEHMIDVNCKRHYESNIPYIKNKRCCKNNNKLYNSIQEDINLIKSFIC